MSIFKRYIEYLKDNPEGYWFKRKIFGWGWVPVKWQGWLAIGIYVFLLVLFSLTLDENSSDKEAALTFFLPLVILTAAFIRLAYKKGEKPKWQWGIPKKESK